MDTPEPDTVLTALLQRLLSRYGGRQLFLFGPEGEPFMAARLPMEPEEFNLLNSALAMIERLESQRPRPFFALDNEHQLIVAALDEKQDLYFVVLLGHEENTSAMALSVPQLPRLSAEARVASLRHELLPYVQPLRRSDPRRL